MGRRWGVPDGVTVGTSVIGASLIDPVGSQTWVLLDDDPQRRLGMALGLAVRAGGPGTPSPLHLLVEDPADAGVLARRASQLSTPIDVWQIAGADLVEVEPAAAAVDQAPPPEAELYRPILTAAGLEPVVEGGDLIGEFRGLEVARVVVDESGEAHLEAGVGRFDREVGAMMFAHLSEADERLARVVDVVRLQRHAGADPHPLNRLVPERWLRSVVVNRPELVGAARLEPVGSACPRRNLRENGVATAMGVDAAGHSMVVVCSTGIDLDLVPSAVDDRLSHDPSARLVLVVPADDALGITEDLAALVQGGADLLTVPDHWRSLDDEQDR